MMHDNPLIDSLVDDLAPVRPLKMRSGAAAVGLAFAATVAAVFVMFGRPVFLDEPMAEMSIVANGLLLLTGISSALAVVAMASPRVGAAYDGPKWAMAGLALLPLAALIAWMAPGVSHGPTIDRWIDLDCALKAGASSLLVALSLGLWLRRGAPVAPERAGLFLGVAASALGSAAYGLTCPLDGLAHLGVWHIVPVFVTGLVGRIAGPRLIRW
ncbi:hypothetical protein A6F68_01239 [Tsuneonella dongtanensis]|uniref:DUF1109 domain-containing protein n=1 Tax=Tsuneonella dongtanensis TaxID=692370 RepID=A0A1B2AC81_9SPHN|nr:NrsF family protein [Tsuneonella dongtanensis]ANY19756.1 hypothetical protein A6F68_01239 [Tsuneonella dongtanensis]